MRRKAAKKPNESRFFFALLCAFAAYFGLAVHVASARATQSALRDSQLQQASLQNRVQQIDQQIGSILDEFGRNGLADAPEVKTLRGVRMILSSLSADEMDKVVALLRRATDAASPDASRPLVSSAYARQKSILAQLDQLLLEFHRQQTIAELGQRFAQLAQRQQANLKATIDLARQANQRPRDQWENPLRESQAVQQQEQASLKTDIAEAIGDLGSMAQAAAPDAMKILRPAAEYAKVHGVAESAAGAADDLGAGNLFRAAGNEKKVRDDLRRLARLLSTSTDKRANLSRAKEELEQAISDQSTVAFQVLNPKTDLVDAEQNQAAVVDQVDPLKSDLADISQPAAQSVARAQEQMQEARAAMNEKDREASASRAKDALDNLQKAHNELQSELAKATSPQPATKPLDAQALQKLQSQRDQLANLIKQQQSLNLQTAQVKPGDAPQLAPGEEKLAEQTSSASQQPAAMADAHSKMQSAAKHLENQDPAAANSDQQAALADMMQAKRALDGRLSSAHPDAARDGKTLDQIGRDLAKAQEQLGQPSPPSPQSLSSLSQQIGQLAVDDQGALPESAQGALEQSRQSLRDAAASKQSLTQAQESLAKAQAAVALARARLTSQALAASSSPPSPPPPTPPPPDSSSSSSSSSDSESNSNSASAKESQPADGNTTSRFLALPARDRAALLQGNPQSDPPQFAPQIQQYRRNLAGEGQ